MDCLQIDLDLEGVLFSGLNYRYPQVYQNPEETWKIVQASGEISEEALVHLVRVMTDTRYREQIIFEAAQGLDELHDEEAEENQE